MRATLYDQAPSQIPIASMRGANGELAIDDAGITWTPSWWGARRGRTKLTLPWSLVESADIVRTEKGSSLLTIRTAGGDVRILTGVVDGELAAEMLSRFLETR